MTQDLKPDIVIIAEANLEHSTQDYQAAIPGFKLIKTKDHQRGYCSRLVVLIREGLEFQILDKIMEPDISSIWVKLPGRGTKPTIIGAVYREHNLLGRETETDSESQQNFRWKRFLEQWGKVEGKGDLFIAGDINLDKLKWDQPENGHKRMITDMKDKIETKGYSQVVKGPTRFWAQTTPSLIDHLWTKCPQKIIQCSNISRPTADHNIIVSILRRKGSQKGNEEVRKRQWNSLDIEKLKQRISEVDWTQLYNQEDPNLAYDLLETQLQEALDSQIPVRNFQTRKDYRPWVKKETKETMEQRDIARMEAVRTDTEENWKNFRKLRNKVTELVKKDKRNYMYNLYNNTEKDPKTLYRITRSQLGWSTAGPPSSLLVDGVVKSSPKEIANEQLSYFVKKIEKLNKELPDSTEDPLAILDAALARWGGNARRDEQFNLKEISLLDTIRLIGLLGNTHSMGHDNLDALTIKLLTPSIAAPIRHILNLSMKKGLFCNKWKLTKIVPLLKDSKMEKMSSSSYRPIALLPIISKIAEKSVQEQLLTYMETSKQLNRNLHGYRTLHSTTTAALQLTEFTAEAADDRKISTMLFLDQSAAFDCVRHDILLSKLQRYNFSDRTLAWFSSYLEARTQYVEVGGKMSRMVAVAQGVPQGSVLGPLLYSLYTNELAEMSKDDFCDDLSHENNGELFGKNCRRCGIIACFADDTTFATARKTRGENETETKEKLDKISKFLVCNKLTVNQGKTKMLESMVRQRRCKNTENPPQLTIEKIGQEDKIIKCQTSTRLLGLNLQNDMSWRAHLESGEKALLPTLRRRLGALRHVGKYISRKGKLTLTNGLILSKIMYMIPVWGGTERTHIRKVQTLLNSTARYVLNKGKRTRTRELMEGCGWMFVEEMTRLHSLVTMWKLVNSGKPPQLMERMTITEDRKLDTVRPRLITTENYFRWRTRNHWNELPQYLREETRLIPFKKQLKKLIIEDRNKPRNQETGIDDADRGNEGDDGGQNRD